MVLPDMAEPQEVPAVPPAGHLCATKVPVPPTLHVGTFRTSRSDTAKGVSSPFLNSATRSSVRTTSPTPGRPASTRTGSGMPSWPPLWLLPTPSFAVPVCSRGMPPLQKWCEWVRSLA